MRLFRPFILSRLLYPGALFRIRTKEKELCLTFDDGPDPESTPRILDILEAHNVKAIFFCLGQKAGQYPHLVSLIISKGHIIGNHGYLHLSGWKTNTVDYIENVSKAAKLTSPYLFRPPYGRIRPSQYRELVKQFRIIFWDLMPFDFDEQMSNENTLNVLKTRIRPGSVIVLHDKTSSKVLTFLSDFIKYARSEGYEFVNSSLAGIIRKPSNDGNTGTPGAVGFRHNF
jgi:peptidoglycan/xylan/chitin deacetylase (PgdA/CDA1 family)